MLRHKLYKVNSIKSATGDPGNSAGLQYSISVSLQPDHEIFKGHFPGNPVLPGVSKLEIARELAEDILGCECMLAQASQIKFLNMINPEKHPLFEYDLKLMKISEGEYDMNASVGSGTVVFMKMKGRLKEFKSGQKL